MQRTIAPVSDLALAWTTARFAPSMTERTTPIVACHQIRSPCRVARKRRGLALTRPPFRVDEQIPDLLIVTGPRTPRVTVILEHVGTEPNRARIGPLFLLSSLIC